MQSLHDIDQAIADAITLLKTQPPDVFRRLIDPVSDLRKARRLIQQARTVIGRELERQHGASA